MSRSIFALKFEETVGTSPMEYLTRWAAGRGQADEFRRSRLRHRPVARLRIQKAPSANLSKGSWGVRHGNIAVAEIRLPLPIKRRFLEERLRRLGKKL